MKKISRKNLPTQLPITNTILIAFLLYFFNATGLIWGMFITFEVLLFIGTIYNLYKEEYVDIIEKEEKK